MQTVSSANPALKAEIDRRRTYAIIEVVIAALALMLPLELAAVRPWLANAYADGGPGVMFALLRLASSLFLLATPAAAMHAWPRRPPVPRIHQSAHRSPGLP